METRFHPDSHHLNVSVFILNFNLLGHGNLNLGLEAIWMTSRSENQTGVGQHLLIYLNNYT